MINEGVVEDFVCEYCQAPAVDERMCKRHGRLEAVCEQCRDDLDAGDEMDRREDAYERAVDQSLSEWKDEGKPFGGPRPVARRWR